LDAYRDCQQKSQLIECFLKKFTKERLDEFVELWWSDATFKSKEDIIKAGIEGFLADTQSGAITALKTLYSEIEGIVRIKYCTEKQTSHASFNDLVKYIEAKGDAAFDPSSLAFPTAFYEYLRKQVFANFDVQAGNVPMSRHSSSHGVAGARDYTRARALQAILTLDQLRHYLR
jgi:hypothetical protein